MRSGPAGWALLVVAACGAPSPPPVVPEPEPPAVEWVDVAHRRELRGVWIATVSNIDWPSRPGLPLAAQQAELDAIVDVAASIGLNALFFQVRSEGDAMYASREEPWARALSGTQGVDPGYDPLAYLIEAAHARGIQIHAWFNPYRAQSGVSSRLVPPHMALQWPEYAYRWGPGTWMDPGAKVVEDRLVTVVSDVVDRYDVDGIHMDDYFYPYPDGSKAFPDGDTYAAYVRGGGALARDDWRRANVDALVARVHDAVVQRDPSVRFGISPFGIYRPGVPPGITGLDQVATIYADPLKWTAAGDVDYLAPQLYWPHTKTAQAYEPLLAWWTANGGTSIFAGNFLSQLGSSESWTLDEFRTQLAITRATPGAGGNIWFSWAPIAKDTQGIRAVFRDEFYPTPALPPPVREVATVVPAPPEVAVTEGAVTCAPGGPERVRAWVVYRDEGGFSVDRIVPAAASRIPLSPGRYAITAVSRGDVESRGVVVTVE